MKPVKAGQRGFTLLEVLLAIAILSVILTALYSTFFLAQKALAGLDESLLGMHELRTALQSMELEAEAAFPDDKYPFTVKDRDIYGRQASVLSFSTFSLPGPGLSRVSYYVQENDGALTLYKEISPAYDENAEALSAPLIEGIESFTVEALDRGAWARTWNNPGVPERLVVSITIRIKEKTFTMSETIIPRIGSTL
jgi:prepilin-type N-terminal cleavage/methylation domain-containing protein